MVKVRFRGPLASRLTTEVFKVQMPSASNLRELLDLLITQYDGVRNIWDSPDRVERDVLLLLNEVDIGLLEGLETILHEDDLLTILPLIHGG